MVNKETPETVAELVALATVGCERPLTDAERARVDKLCALSKPMRSADPSGEPPTCGVTRFWTLIVNCDKPRRDDFMREIKPVVVPHIVRVTQPIVAEYVKRYNHA